MEKYCFDHVKKCHKCQEHNNLIHTLASKLHTQFPIWPFSVWGLDLIGKISPPSSRHMFIIMATYYFTKWVEAILLHSMTTNVIFLFILENILIRFVLPYVLGFI